jgi:hypothetical protein
MARMVAITCMIGASAPTGTGASIGWESSVASARRGL